MNETRALTPSGWGGKGEERPPLPPIQINQKSAHTHG